MRFFKLMVLFLAVVPLAGCATANFRTSPNYTENIKKIKTIAVMPPDVKMYEITAGGMTQEMDEWSELAKKNITEALKKKLADRYEVKIKFIEEKWLKENKKDAWLANNALYNAVSDSAYTHAFNGLGQFPAKKEIFDYSLGTEIASLSTGLDADALLFVWGVDTQVSAGRAAVEFFQAALAGVYYFHTSVLTLGLIDAKTGDLEWIAVPPNAKEYDFRNPKHIEVLVGCLTDTYLKKP